MKRTLIGLMSLGLLLGALPLAASATTTPGRMAFGMESSSMAAQASAGVKADYGTFWIGPWTLSSGWGSADTQLTNMNNAGVTPAIHFYYWGDDITPSCVENGCWSSLHNAQKDRAHWKQLAQQMTDHMNSKMGGKPVMVFLESEFNKGGISTYEPFDGYMADMADYIHSRYPNAKVVLAFGNWGSENWHNFDRIAAKSDFTGLQGMRGSTHETGTAYSNLYDSTLAGVQKLKTLFNKPIVLTDIALSSYPEPTYLTMQKDALAKFFSHMQDLKALGVQAMIYRSWYDSPTMDLANYYGMAERYWGLASKTTGIQKPAALVWIAGVKAERASSTTTSPPATTSTTTSATVFTASFTPTSSANAWWVEAKVTGNHALSGVSATVNGGSAHALGKTSYGTYAASFSAPKGSMVVFTAKDTTGHAAVSPKVAWMVSYATVTGTSGTTATSTGTAAPATSTSASSTTTAFTASFSPKSLGNDWWVETGVTANKAVTKVQVRINGGSLVDLPKDSWGTYAKSLNAPNNSKVVFVATASTGQTATSTTYTWT
ncbi:MAG TPA: hypothetical protein VM286_05385 [Candidatus Thermoplasmatota archaeon]|nr:hypothetical protein [Candidatus Thermoplasmatota archaeon]